ncbi:unnamed protein product, partial [marine sediment metagenome]
GKITSTKAMTNEGSVLWQRSMHILPGSGWELREYEFFTMPKTHGEYTYAAVTLVNAQTIRKMMQELLRTQL